MTDQDIAVRAREILDKAIEEAGDAYTSGEPDEDAWAKSIALRAIEAALRSTGGEGWRDIATAPKNGSTILLAERTWGGGLVVTPGRWFEDEQGWWEHGSHPTDYADQTIDNPTHWQPLPAPPTSDAGERG